MTSYNGTEWTVLHTTCPDCSQIQRTQGFEVVVDETQSRCAECAEQKRVREFHASDVYQAWLASRPAIMTNEEYAVWVAEHPAPQ